MTNNTGPGKDASWGAKPYLGTDDDEALLAELRHAVAKLDPPPASVDEFTMDLLSWRDPDAELAALIADSRRADRSRPRREGRGPSPLRSSSVRHHAGGQPGRLRALPGHRSGGTGRGWPGRHPPGRRRPGPDRTVGGV